MNGERKNPYALYVYCDAAMDYDSHNSGGVGFQIEFPEHMNLTPIQESIGKYVGANIERLELEAIYQGMKKLLELYRKDIVMFSGVNTIIFKTDRHGLNDHEKTSAYRIRDWRKNDWCNHEGKAIKNSEILDKIDKLRKKLTNLMRVRLDIQFGKRKYNKAANKLARSAKAIPVLKTEIEIKGLKVGKRKFGGDEINYKLIKMKDEFLIHVYKKEAVGDQFEISSEISDGEFEGKKVKIYGDYKIEKKMKRGNAFVVRIKTVGAHHVTIYKTIKKSRISNESRIYS